MIKIGIIGSGYVGLATALTFGELGHEIICGDIDLEKVEQINIGKSPVHEAGFDEKLSQLISEGRLKATANILALAQDSEFIFICVDTPMGEDGSMDSSALEKVAETIAPNLNGQLVIIKSTTILGTARKIADKYNMNLCHNPEFLREGMALHDSLNPDRIVIGCDKPENGQRLMSLYENFNCSKLITNLETSEMIKYASNIFLATKITYANEMANICEIFGVDVYEVMEGVKLDKRISPQFLEAGAGFGGSCFPKDLNAMASAVKNRGYEPNLINSVLKTNESQPLRVIELLESEIGYLEGKKIAVLGLAFKEDSDDIRNSRAIPIVETLIQKDANLILYDPKATENFKNAGFENLEYANSLESALTGSDGAIIQTKWQEIRELKPSQIINLMNNPVIIDGRRALNPEKMLADGVKYLGIGWKNL